MWRVLYTKGCLGFVYRDNFEAPPFWCVGSKCSLYVVCSLWPWWTKLPGHPVFLLFPLLSCVRVPGLCTLRQCVCRLSLLHTSEHCSMPLCKCGSVLVGLSGGIKLMIETEGDSLWLAVWIVQQQLPTLCKAQESASSVCNLQSWVSQLVFGLCWTLEVGTNTSEGTPQE